MYMFEKLFMVIELLIEVVVVKNYMDPVVSCQDCNLHTHLLLASHARLAA